MVILRCCHARLTPRSSHAESPRALRDDASSSSLSVALRELKQHHEVESSICQRTGDLFCSSLLDTESADVLY